MKKKVSNSKIFDFLGILSGHERRQLAYLLMMILLMALLDALGVVSIMPFIGVIANPELIRSNTILAHISQFVGSKTDLEFLLFLGIMLFCIFIFSIFFRAVTNYSLMRFAHICEYNIGLRLLKTYLGHPYAWFLDKNSSELSKTILSELNQVIHGVLIPLLLVTANIAVSIAIVSVLVVINPELALFVGVGATGFFVLISTTTRNFVNRIGQERTNANSDRYSLASSIFGGIKEIKFGSLEQKFTERFDKASKLFADSHSTSQALALTPRFLLEAIAFGGIMLFTLYNLRQGNGMSDLLPLLALYTLAGYRLMPSLQQIYANYTLLRFSWPALKSVKSDLATEENANHTLMVASNSKIKLKNSIEVKSVHYRYGEASPWVLEGLSLTIPAFKTIGLVGLSGSGKTTTVDLILGLLGSPNKGKIEIDGSTLDANNLRQWQRSLGYVPQNIFLLDDTIAANIAFGEDTDTINLKKVRNAAKLANLDEFVMKDLPKRYETLVGERGVRVSGGQMQRIGIARALYNKPEILILDEATSSLDTLTENAVMEAVETLSNKITIIIIAHRITTIKKSDFIYVLSKGRIEAHGVYDDLLKRSKTLQEMVLKG